MNIEDISKLVLTSERRKALKALVKEQGAGVYSLAGSSAAMMLTAIPSPNNPLIVVGDSLDDAGYLYFDLCRIAGDSKVAFMPSGYRRDIKYGQPDPPNQILRTETLRRLSAGGLGFLVTYPEALAETVASKEELTAQTMTLRKGMTIDMNDVSAWLFDNGFNRVDYVYEPGQFAVRGSIFDIFSYACEQPVRLDFFGDDIESIRLFNVETQLSESKVDSVDISANMAEGSGRISLLNFIAPDSIIALRNESFTVERVKAVAETGISAFTLLTEDGNADAVDDIIDPEAFEQHLAKFRRVGFSAAKLPDGGASKSSIDFNCSPQGIYHKNFDLISK